MAEPFDRFRIDAEAAFHSRQRAYGTEIVIVLDQGQGKVREAQTGIERHRFASVAERHCTPAGSDGPVGDIGGFIGLCLGESSPAKGQIRSAYDQSLCVEPHARWVVVGCVADGEHQG